MRSIAFLLLATIAVLLLPAAAVVQDRFVTDVNTTPRRGEPGLKPNAACAPTDDPVQCAALVDLYNSTNGDKWRVNTGWLNGSSYCDWNWKSGSFTEGVKCDSSGNVIELYVRRRAHRFSLAQLFLTQHRSYSHCCRDLYSNKLTGTIPDSLGNLKSLINDL